MVTNIANNQSYEFIVGSNFDAKFTGTTNGVLILDLAVGSTTKVNISGNIGKNFATNLIKFSTSAKLNLTGSYGATFSTASQITTITVTDTSGNTLAVLSIAGDVFGLQTNYGGFTQTNSGTVYNNSLSAIGFKSTSAGATICFLAGSLIETPTGRVAVETLELGDELIAFVNGTAVSRRIIWAGRARCDVRSHLPDDEAGYPVRILKNAITDGVPYKDMLITGEHCLFLDGRFVPARMLVNGRSIFFDRSFSSYEYFHIETEDHSVIKADGVLTESYLDTGNRGSFSQSGNVVAFGGTRDLSWADAAAPLDVTSEFVRPLFAAIEERATNAGLPLVQQTPSLTDDTDLHLVTDSGVRLYKSHDDNGRAVFAIPRSVQAVRIVSNASRPCDVVGPFIDDRRSLGVLVGEIGLSAGNQTQVIDAHLTKSGLAGWWGVEDGSARWTTGDATLPLDGISDGTVAFLTIEIKAGGPYILQQDIAPAARRIG